MNPELRDKKIRAMVCAIPVGYVASYGQIAELCGLARGARQVGRALRLLGPNSDVPWHRVIASSGRLSLPPDSDSYQRQCERLIAEGVLVSRGRVSLKKFRWQPDIDELLWSPAALETP